MSERPVPASEVRELGRAFRHMARLLFQASRNNKSSRYGLAGLYYFFAQKLIERATAEQVAQWERDVKANPPVRVFFPEPTASRLAR